jgi:hypothetical protein
MLSKPRKTKNTILAFPLERVEKTTGARETSAQIYILPSIRIERHSDHPEMRPKLKRKRA